MGKKKGSGVSRFDPDLQKEIENLLDKNGNRTYCKNVPTFLKIAAREMLDRLHAGDDKIRIKL